MSTYETRQRDYAELARRRSEYSAAVARRSVEREISERNADADRRHERRLVALQAAIRVAFTENNDVFNSDADVVAMATAAVITYERERGR